VTVRATSWRIETHFRTVRAEAKGPRDPVIYLHLGVQIEHVSAFSRQDRRPVLTAYIGDWVRPPGTG